MDSEEKLDSGTVVGMFLLVLCVLFIWGPKNLFLPEDS